MNCPGDTSMTCGGAGVTEVFLLKRPSSSPTMVPTTSPMLVPTLPPVPPTYTHCGCFEDVGRGDDKLLTGASFTDADDGNLDLTIKVRNTLRASRLVAHLVVE